MDDEDEADEAAEAAGADEGDPNKSPGLTGRTPNAIPSGRRRVARRGLLLAAGIVVVLLGPFLLIGLVNRGRVLGDVEDVPARRVAIVFGAGLNSAGRPTPFLAHRLDMAVELYREGKAEKLLMTGDNSRRDHDEVTAMKSYVVERGIDPKDVTLDHAGFDTYDSCYRAKAIFGVEEAILVTQSYHLPRAVHTCRRLGVDAVGVGPSEWAEWPRQMVGFQARELLADWKALWDLHIAHPEPKFLGPPEDSP